MRCLLTLLGMLTCLTAFSAPRTYTVHILIFSHLTPQSVSAEAWPVLPTVNITPASTMHKAFALHEEAKKLAQTPSYQVLFDGAWRLTWTTDNQRIVLPFSNGENTQGTLSIGLGHYFDVHSDIFYAAPLGLLRSLDSNHYFSHIDQSPFIFSLTQDRRMKSQELNYLATPVLGMLIEMTR